MIRLGAWTHPASGERRVYISGTPRDASRLYVAEHDGGYRISSRTIDLPASRLAGNVYQKRQKDRAAAAAALDALGLRFRPFADILAVAEGQAPLVEILPP